MLVFIQLVVIFAASVCYLIGAERLQRALHALRGYFVPRPAVAAEVEGEPSDCVSFSSTFDRHVAQLPSNTRGELACLLRLGDLMELSAVSRALQVKFWECIDVWQTVAVRRRVRIPTAPSTVKDVRRAVRHAAFHLDGKQLRTIGARSSKEVLSEVGLMLRGLQPEDISTSGTSAVDLNYMISRAERALSDFDPESRDSTSIADSFMEIVHSSASLHLLEESLVERLTHAYNSTLQLHDLMMSAMKSHLRNQIQSMQEDMWEEPARPSTKQQAAPSKVPELGPLERKRLRKQVEMQEQPFDWRGFKVSGGASM